MKCVEIQQRLYPSSLRLSSCWLRGTGTLMNWKILETTASHYDHTLRYKPVTGFRMKTIIAIALGVCSTTTILFSENFGLALRLLSFFLVHGILKNSRRSNWLISVISVALGRCHRFHARSSILVYSTRIKQFYAKKSFLTTKQNLLILHNSVDFKVCMYSFLEHAWIQL